MNPAVCHISKHSKMYPKVPEGWYFYDETWTALFGPYSTCAEAEKGLVGYGQYLNYGPTLWQRIWWRIVPKYLLGKGWYK